MTRREELTSMRPRDLIALADRLGVKVAASKNRVNLKEKKSDIVDRILRFEGGSTIAVDTESEQVSTPEMEELMDALQSLSDIYPDIEVRKFEELGAYDLFRNGQFIASIAPWSEGVGIASVITDFVDYADVANEIDALLTV